MHFEQDDGVFLLAVVIQCAKVDQLIGVKCVFLFLPAIGRGEQYDPSALQKSAQARDILMEESDMYFKMDQDIDTTLANIDSRINAAIKDAMAE